MASGDTKLQLKIPSCQGPDPKSSTIVRSADVKGDGTTKVPPVNLIDGAPDARHIMGVGPILHRSAGQTRVGPGPPKMLKIRKSPPAIALTLVLGQANAFDVHGVRIGDRWDSDRIEQALSYVTVPTLQRVKCSTDSAQTCVGTTHYLDADVRVIVEGENGRVTKITMTLPTGNFDEEIAALKREYGQPANEWSAGPDSAGPLLFSRRIVWLLPNEEMFAVKFSAMATISLTRPGDSVANRYPPPS